VLFSTGANTCSRTAVLDDAIDPIAVDFLRAQIEPEPLAHHGSEEAADRVLLPMGRAHDGSNRRSLRSAQHREHASLFRARPAVAPRAGLWSSPQHFERDPIPYALETDWPVGVAGFEPLHLRIGFAKTLRVGLEDSNLCISKSIPLLLNWRTDLRGCGRSSSPETISPMSCKRRVPRPIPRSFHARVCGKPATTFLQK
jgi:hypothetical protein